MTTAIQRIKTTYHLTLEALTPIHIGNGQTLLRDLDFVAQENNTYVLDLNRFAEWAGTTQTSSDWMGMKPGTVLKDVPIDRQPFVLYRLSQVPLTDELYTQIKDVYGRPYIPGSTLKGWLRTSLLWSWYRNNQQVPPLQSVLTKGRPRRETADDDIQRARFGTDAHHDLLRLFHFSDTTALEQTELSLYNVATHNSSRTIIAPIEAIPPHTTWHTTLKVDDYLLDTQRANELGWKDKVNWVQLFGEALRDFSIQRITQEAEYWQGEPSLRSFYKTLQQPVAANQFFAQIGWGTGWNSKTLNDLLLRQEDDFGNVIRKYRLQGDKSPNYEDGDLFPQTRRVTMQDGTPTLPLGWMLITVDVSA